MDRLVPPSAHAARAQPFSWRVSDCDAPVYPPSPRIASLHPSAGTASAARPRATPPVGPSVQMTPPGRHGRRQSLSSRVGSAALGLAGQSMRGSAGPPEASLWGRHRELPGWIRPRRWPWAGRSLRGKENRTPAAGVGCVGRWVLGGWRRRTLPPGVPGSTIRAERLNGRVRDGNGCGPLAEPPATSIG